MALIDSALTWMQSELMSADKEVAELGESNQYAEA